MLGSRLLEAAALVKALASWCSNHLAQRTLPRCHQQDVQHPEDLVAAPSPHLFVVALVALPALQWASHLSPLKLLSA